MILENDGISANTIGVATTALRGTTLSKNGHFIKIFKKDIIKRV